MIPKHPLTTSDSEDNNYNCLNTNNYLQLVHKNWNTHVQAK